MLAVLVRTKTIKVAFNRLNFKQAGSWHPFCVVDTSQTIWVMVSRLLLTRVPTVQATFLGLAAYACEPRYARR